MFMEYLIIQMRIEYPEDFQYSQSGLRKTSIHVPNARLPPNTINHRRKRLPKLLTQKNLPRCALEGPTPNYFQSMYKQVKRNTYINLFIRKLKQTTISKRGICHKLCQQQNYSQYHQMHTFLFNKQLQIIYTILQILLILTTCIVASICIAFPYVNQTHTVRMISMAMVLYGCVSIFLMVFSRSSIDVKNQKKAYVYVRDAWKNFGSLWVWVDIAVMAVYAVDWLYPTNAGIYFKIVIMVKLMYTLNKISSLEILLISNCFREQYWQLVKVFFFNFLFAHFLAIVLLLMANINTQQNQSSQHNGHQNWLQNKGLINLPWDQKYIWSYYWATTIMLTVGFGDIAPVRTQQVFILIFIQMLSCIFLAYNINSVGKIIKKITSYEQQKVSNLKIFTQMQAKQNVSQDIKKKITNYITQSTQLKRNFNVDEEKQLIEKLPRSFYDQFRRQSNFNIFGSIPFFRNLNFSKLRQIALKIDKKLTHPQQIIVQSGNVPGVLIVNNGHICFTMNRIGLVSHGKQIQSLKISSQEYKILSLYFFINKPINYDIKCKDYAIVYSISKKQLQNLLSTNYSSYQYYCMTKDKDRYNSNDWQINKCQLCLYYRSLHTLFECPKLHYVPIKDIVVARILRKNPEKIKNIIENKNGIRIQKQSINALKIYNQIQKQYQQINQLAMNRSNLSKKNQKRKGIYQSRKKIINIKGALKTVDDLPLSEQLEHILRSKLYEQFSVKKIQGNSIDFKQVCKQVGEKLKDQLLKTSFFNAMDFGFDVQCDVAYDYASYFHMYNPSMLSKRKMGERNPIFQVKNNL